MRLKISVTSRAFLGFHNYSSKRGAIKCSREFTQQPRASTSASHNRDMSVDSEGQESDDNGPAGAPLSPPMSPMFQSKAPASMSKMPEDSGVGMSTNDPLSEFYAKARAEQEIGVRFIFKGQA